MPDDQTKPRRRVVGRSKTHPGTNGKVLVLSDPLDRGYVCQKMCVCNVGAKINKAGQILRQRCTTVGIWADEEINQLVWRYKAEVGFSMKSNPPRPLMSKDQPNRPSRFPLGRAMGEGLLKRDLEGKAQKGLLRIPDCIILKSTGVELAEMRASESIDWPRLIPIQRNIETVLEIKFDGDRLSPFQERDYKRIAGDERFRLLKISDCDCGRKRPPPDATPVRTPVTTPMKLESDEGRRWYQLPQPQPLPAPPPQPQIPRYGPTGNPSEHRTLASLLKENPGKAGVILVGAILLIIPATRAAIIGAAGVTLVVASNNARATDTTNKAKNDQEH